MAKVISIKWKANKFLNFHLKKEDILKLEVQAIVNPANSMLKHGGGLAKLIKDNAGGENFQKESDDYIRVNGSISPGNCGTTSKGSLANPFVSHIIHSVGPIWNNGHENEKIILGNTFSNIFKEAKRLNISSLGVPPISTGIFRFPKDLAADIFYDILNKHANKNERPLEHIYMSIFDEPTFKEFYNRFQVFYNKEKSGLELIKNTVEL